MKHDTEDAIVEIVAYAVVIAVLLAIAACIGSYRCQARWEQSGMPSKWRPLSGCRIETAPGTWMPADTYRAIHY